MPENDNLLLGIGNRKSNTLANSASTLNQGSANQGLSDYDLNSVDYDINRTLSNPTTVLKNKGLQAGEADQVIQGANKRQESESLWNTIKHGINSVLSPNHDTDQGYLHQFLGSTLDAINPAGATNKIIDQVTGRKPTEDVKTPYDQLLNQSMQAYVENKGTDAFFNNQDTITDFSTGQKYNAKEVQKYLDAGNVMQIPFTLSSPQLKGNKLLTMNPDNFTKLATGDPNAQHLKLDGELEDDQRKMFYSYKDPKTNKYQLGMVSFKDIDQIKKIGGSVISAYGPKPFATNVALAFQQNFMGSIAQTPKMVADYVKDITNLGSIMDNPITPSLITASGKKNINENTNHLDNLAQIYAVQSSENADTNFFSPESMSGQVGSGLASITEYAALGGLGRVAGETMGLGKALTAVLEESTAKKAFEQIIQFGAGSVLNHAEAYDSGKALGMNDETLAAYALTVGSINSAVESQFGSNAMFYYLSGGGDRTIARTVLNDVTAELGQDLSKVTKNQMIKALGNNVGKSFSKIKGGISDFLEKPILGTAAEEGFEEFAQTLVSKASESIYDQAFTDKSKGDAQFGTSFWSKDTAIEALKSGFVGALVGAIGGLPEAYLGAKHHNSEEGILPHIVDGNSEKVKAVTNKLYDEGYITEPIKDAYIKRVDDLNELYTKNKSSFSNLDNYSNKSDLKAEALHIINARFDFNSDIRDINKTIGEIKADNSLTDVEKQIRVQKEQNKIYDLQTKSEFYDKLLKDYTNDTENPDNTKVVAGEDKYVNRNEVIQSRLNQYNLEKKLTNIDTKVNQLNTDIETESIKTDFLGTTDEQTGDTRRLADEAAQNVKKYSEQKAYLEKNKEIISNKLEEVNKNHERITSPEYQKQYLEELNKPTEETSIEPDTQDTSTIPQDTKKQNDVVDRDKISNKNNLSMKDKLESQISDIEDELQNPDLDPEVKNQLTQAHTEITDKLKNLGQSNMDNINQDMQLIQSYDANMHVLDINPNEDNQHKLDVYNKILSDINKRVEGNRAQGIKDNTHFDPIIFTLKNHIAKYTELAKADVISRGKNEALNQAKVDEDKKLVGSDKKNVIQKDNYFTTVYRLPFMEDNTEFYTNEEVQSLLTNTHPDDLNNGLTITFRPIEQVGNYKAGTQSSDTNNHQTKLVYPKLNAVVEFMGKKIGLLPESDKLNLYHSKRGLVLINWSTLSKEDFNKFISTTADYDLTLQHVQNLQKIESLAGLGKSFTTQELQNLGINIKVTSTGVEVNSGERTKLGDQEFAKLPTNGGKPFIYDRARGIVYNEGTTDMLGVNGVKDPETINVDDRYLVLNELPNGQFQWITGQGTVLSSEKKALVFEHMKKIAKALKEDPNNSKLFIKLKNDLNKLFYITGKPGQDISIEVTGPSGGKQGRVLLSIRENGGRTAYGLNSKAKSFDGLFSTVEGYKDMNIRENISLNPSIKELNEKLSVNSTQNVLSNLEMKVSFDTDKLNSELAKQSEVNKSSTRDTELANGLTYKELAVGDRVKTGNKEGVITAKINGKVVIDFDKGGKLAISPSFAEINKIESTEEYENFEGSTNYDKYLDQTNPFEEYDASQAAEISINKRVPYEGDLLKADKNFQILLNISNPTEAEIDNVKFNLELDYSLTGESDNNIKQQLDYINDNYSNSEVQQSKNEVIDNSDKIASIKAIREDFDKLPDEAQKDILSKIDNDLLDKYNTSTGLTQVRAKNKIQKIITGVIANPKYGIKEEGNGLVFSIEESRSKQDQLIDIENAKEYINTVLPSTIEVKDINNIMDNIVNNGSTWGAFHDSTIFLNTQAGEGTQYHEAFHAVFRTLLDDKQINVTLNAAKNKFGESSKSDLKKLRELSSAYRFMTDNELRDLHLEEKMANDFKQYKLDKIADKKNNTIFKRIWDKIINLADFIRGNRDELASLYHNIDNSSYKDATFKPNKFKLREDPAFEIFKTDNTGEKTTTIKEGKNIVYTLAGLLFKAKQEGKIDIKSKLDELIQEKLDFNSIDNPFFDKYFEDNNIQDGTDRFNRTIESIERLKYIYSDRDNVTRMKKAVLDMYKIFTTEDIKSEEDREKEINDVGERWNIDPWSLGGMSSLSTAMREYIAFTLYSSKDIFGRPIETAVDPLIVYRGLTRALAGLPEDSMMQRFKQHVEYNEEAKSFFNKFINDTQMDSETMNINTTKNSDLLRKFINAFKNENIGWYTVLHDTLNGKANVIESNRKSAKNIQVDEWSNKFLALGGDRLSIPEVKGKFNSALTQIKLSYNKVSEKVDENTLKTETSNIVNSFKKLGINISEGYTYFSLLARQNELGIELSQKQKDYYNSYSQNKGLFNNNYEDLNEITSQINKGDNPFVKQLKLVNGKNIETGALSRLERFAETNALFDESVGDSTFQNADGKNVYSILKSSFGLTKLRLLKESSYRASLLTDKFISPNGVPLNHLLNNQYSDEIFSAINPSLLDGYRDENEGEGVTFGKFDSKQYLQSELALFLNRKALRAIEDGKSNKVGDLGYFNFNQMEASNTAYLVNLPVDEYYNNSKIHNKALDILHDYFTQEAYRIFEVNHGDNKEIYKGYNDKPDARGYKFFEFKGLTIASEFEDVIKNLKNKQELIDHLASTKEQVKDAIKAKLTNDIAKYKILLDDNLVSRLETQQKSNGKVLNDKNKDDIIGDFYINSYLNTLGINNLLLGDAAKGIKNTVDWFKRAKGIIGSGNDLGLGTHNVAVSADPIRYLDNDLNRTEEITNKVQTGDAQSHVTLAHRLLEVTKWGRANSDITGIYSDMQNGKKISFEDYQTLAENGAALNSVKTVTYDGTHYFKLSELILTPNLVGAKDKDGNVIMTTIKDNKGNDIPFPKKALSGFEYHYGLYKSMITHGVDQHIYETGSKMATLNPVKFNKDGNYDFSNSIMQIDNQFKRLQVETPTGKTKIVDGTQLLQLISSEQKDELPVDFKYNKDIKTLGELRDHFRSLLADNRYDGFKDALAYVIDPETKEVNISKLSDKFYNTVKDSGAGEIMSNFFKPDKFGNRQFNWNLGPIINKAEQLFLAHFSKGVLSQKVPGLKVSLVSDEGITKSNGEKLQHMVKDADGNYYSEAMLPAFAKELIDKDPNSIQDILKMFGIRIPTQDKQSMLAIKVVGFLPTEYGSVGIFPHELVYLSGADFDIDSLYIHRPDYYIKDDGSLVPYGKYADTQEKKYSEYIDYQLSHNKDLVKLIKGYTESTGNNKLVQELDDIVSRLTQAEEDDTDMRDGYSDSNAEEMYRTINQLTEKKNEQEKDILKWALEDSNLPSTQEEFNKTNPVNIASNNNAMLEAKLKFLTNDFVREGAAKVPATMDSIKDVNDIINDGKDPLRDQDNYSTSPNTALERFKANRSNSEGKNGIGPIALMNNLHAFLSIHDVKLFEPTVSIDNMQSKGFGGNLTLDGQSRKNNELSTLLSAMTDNAKEQLAAKLNLTFNKGDKNNTLPVAGYMLSNGYNMEQTMLYLNQPVIYNITKGDGSLKETIKDKLFEIFNKTIFDKNSNISKQDQYESWINSMSNGLSTDSMKNDIKDIQPNNDSLINIEPQTLVNQLQVYDSFQDFKKQSGFTTSVSNLLALNKGLESNFVDNKKFDRSVKDSELGHILAFSNKTDYREALKDYESYGLIKKVGDKYIQGKNYPPIYSERVPFDVRLAIINDPNTLQNILIQKEVTNNISKKFFLSQTDLFKNVTEAVTKYDDPDASKYLRSMMMAKSYQKYLSENRIDKFKDLVKSYNTIGNSLKSDPNNIAKQLLSLKANDAFSKNPLVRILTIEDNPKSKFVSINFPTRIKTDSDYYVSLVNGYEELFRNSDTKEFAINLFNYAYFKDGLEFKNNSFINAIGSWMFKDVSEGLDKVNEELATKSTNLQSIFRDEVSTIKDYFKLYTSDINTSEDKLFKINSRDIGKDGSNTLKNVVTEIEKNKTYSFDLFKNTELDHNILLNPDALKYELSKDKSRLRKNMDIFEGTFSTNDVDTYNNFKMPITYISESGTRDDGTPLKRRSFILDSITKLENDGNIQEYSLDDIVNKILAGKLDEISGFKAQYNMIDEIGDKLLNSSVLDYNRALELRKDPKVTETKLPENLDNSEKISNFEESEIVDNTQEAKDKTLYEDMKNSPFLFNEDFNDTDAISNDSIQEHLNDEDDNDLPIC